MTKEQIFEKLIKKAEKNGFDMKPFLPAFPSKQITNKKWIKVLMGQKERIWFGSNFAKTIWGKKLIGVNIDKYLDPDGLRATIGTAGAYIEFILPAWQFHLQQLVVLSEKNKWEYLKKFV